MHERYSGFEDGRVDQPVLVLINDVLDVVELSFHEHAKRVRFFLIEVVGLVVALVPDGTILSSVVDGGEAVLERGRGFLEPTESNLLGVLPDL